MQAESSKKKFILHPLSFILYWVMSVIWAKVWFDLWHNRTRTSLAVLSIAAGVFAVGMMFGMSDLLTANLDKDHRTINAPHLDIALNEFVKRDVWLDLVNVPGVEGVDPYTNISISYRVDPNAKWRPAVIQVRDNYTAQKYELVQLREGHWPRKGDVGIERMAAGFLNAGVGDTVTFKWNEKEYTYPITSKIRHPFVPPPQFLDLAFFFMDGETTERFGMPVGQFNAAFVRVTPYSPEHARDVATALKDQLGKQQISVLGVSYQDPNKHWARSVFDGLALVLNLLSIIAVIISAVLVYNTLSNLITQQIDQIGILKAIGGKALTIIQVYLSEAFVYALLALVVAIPIGAYGANALTQWFLGMFNIDVTGFEISTPAVVYQIISAIGVTLIAGFIPTLQGAFITVRQAISNYGLGSDFGSNWLDRFIERVGARILPAHYATALGNLFRRKGRLLLTQIVLIFAGFAFLLVMSLNTSIALTLDHIFARNQYDTIFQFANLERADAVLPMATKVEGVERAELHLIQSASILKAGQSAQAAGISAAMEGIPPGSDFFTPLMVAGRWLQRGDGRVIVVERDMAERNHITLGDILTMNLGELGRDTWQVVGIYDPVFAGMFGGSRVYAPLDMLYETTKKYYRGSLLYVRTTNHSAAARTTITAQLKDFYEARKYHVAQTQTQSEARGTNEFQFSTFTIILMALSVVVAIVGGIALMGALSISVVERTKEIGVLRAVGARSFTIIGLFLMEGMLQGIMSCLVAVPVSYLLGQPLATALGESMFGAKLDYAYDWTAVAIWLVIMLGISALASILPARSATRISVRASLAYA